MGATPLKPPGVDFPVTPLDIEMVSPSLLFRVSSHKSGEPYFGRSCANRFDDPGKVASKRFGTCYMGFSLTVAFAESVLHDLEPTKGQFALPETEITRRFALTFNGPDLRLANLTGTALLALNGNGELSGTSDYALSQAWAKAVFAHPANVDGFIYMSRRVTNSLAVVLFERTQSSPLPVRMVDYWPLHKHPDYTATINDLRVKPET